VTAPTTSIRCLVFDFDGVLVDSNAVKRSAYFDALGPIGASARLVEQVLDDHRLGDRYVVIREVLRRSASGAAHGDAVERLVAECAGRYNDICERFTATCREIDGASGALERLSARYALYVNSATPEAPLRRVVARRGWAGYFRDVLGRPRTKVENLREILAREALQPAEVVMIGDGEADLDAATACGCGFIGVRSDQLEGRDVLLVDTLTALEPALETLRARGVDARG